MPKAPLALTPGMEGVEIELLATINRMSAWHGLDVSYVPVTGGITNPNFRVTVNGDDFFVKIPGAGTAAFIDRKNCHRANQIAEHVGIGPQVVCFFEDTGVEIFSWIHGYRTLTWGDVYDPKIFLQTVDLIRQFNEHEKISLPLTETAFEQTFKMLRMARDLKTYLPPEIERMEYLAKQIEGAILAGGIHYKPCHNDYYVNNIVINDETGDVKLLDFEYASMNDECYDMGLYSGANYFTEEMDVAFINRYYGEWREERFARLKLYKILADIKWSMWSLVQDKISLVRFDYFNWFGTKMARFRGNSLDPRLDYWLTLVSKGGATPCP